MCFSSGIFGSSLLDSSPLPSPEPIADPGYRGNSTNPSLFVETVNATASLLNRSIDDVTYVDDRGASTPAAATYVPPASSSQATPTQPYTQPPDWLTSVTSLSTVWPSSTTPVPDSGISLHWKQQGFMGNVVLSLQLKRQLMKSYVNFGVLDWCSE